MCVCIGVRAAVIETKREEANKKRGNVRIRQRVALLGRQENGKREGKKGNVRMRVEDGILSEEKSKKSPCSHACRGLHC